MADVPFLGCKISLISKCDIRYEGILYCVDAKESTIALSKVKSYGTETRGDPSCYVAPKDDIYDIIIFRASDVKDLRVDAPEPPGLSDPAIISAHHSYPGQSTSASAASNNNTTFNSTSSNNNTSTGASNQQQATTTGVLPTLNSNGSLSTSGPSNQQHAQKQQKPLLPFMMPTGSKDQQQQHHQQHHQHQQLPTAINYSSAVSGAQRNKPGRQDTRDGKKSNDEQSAGNNKSKQHQQTYETTSRDGRMSSRQADDRRGDRRGDDRRDDRDRRGADRDDHRRGGGGDDGRRGGSERRGMEGRRGDGGRPKQGRGGYDRNHVNSRYINNSINNNNNNYRRGPNRDDNSKGNGPHYRRGPPMGGRRGRSGDRTGAPRNTRKSAPLKFDAEYDFDEANKLFQELDGKMKNLKLKDEKNDELSGERANSKSPATRSESGSGSDSDDQLQGDSKDGFGGSVSGEFYDKTKSFFDNISCEASERSQGKVNKPDWRKERQLNVETFGVSTSYRRGGYRGRSYGANGYRR